MIRKNITSFFPVSSAEFNIFPLSTDDNRLNKVEVHPQDILPVLALRNTVVFPNTIFPVSIGREGSLTLVQQAFENDFPIGAFPQKDLSQEHPSSVSDFTGYGTVAKVIKTFDMPDGTVTALLQSYSRIRMDSLIKSYPYNKAQVSPMEDLGPDPKDLEIPVIAKMLKEETETLLSQSGDFLSKDPISAIESLTDFTFLVNFVATSITLEDFQGKANLLAVSDIKERGLGLLSLIRSQLEVLELKQEINSKVQSGIARQQREYYLNNQLRTIQEELGIDEDEDDDIARLRSAGKKKKWSKEIGKLFEKELNKLEKNIPSSPEYASQYNYLRFFLDLPWNEYTTDNFDLANAAKVLDADHYGLEKVKERILEYLAVLKIKGDMKSPILCLAGPPGVGKTSLGKSVARALGRKYVRVSLGGVHDEPEIRGHRKTYIGALPGRILDAIQKAGTSNPVIVLDEIDKVGHSAYHGDPADALLEALDPEQNSTFYDHYLDAPYDLSKVLFIATANTTATVQAALMDRMELIPISGYLAEEKIQIAKKFLIPKVLKDHGLKKTQLKISDSTLNVIIEKYTHESGVRGLEKQLAKIARVTARKIATEEELPKAIKEEHLRDYLGLPVISHDKVRSNELPGVVTGLAWTALGGEILFVESSVSEGKGVLSTTGNLGDVMKESASIAYQYIKAHPQMAGLTAEELAKKDIHLHVPEGAVPKDGPSAGITMVCSMLSALRGQSVKDAIAMTGEMTLRGRVLPVGGIKEKILAAKRAGVNTIFLSSENRNDVEDIKDIYVKGLTFVYVDTIDDVVKGIF